MIIFPLLASPLPLSLSPASALRRRPPVIDSGLIVREDPHVAARALPSIGGGSDCAALDASESCEPLVCGGSALVCALHAWRIFLPHSLERTTGLIDNSWEKEPLLYFQATAAAGSLP